MKFGVLDKEEEFQLVTQMLVLCMAPVHIGSFA
jgi:hypothetical protein